MSKQEALDRIAAQASDQDREAVADIISDSKCPLGERLNRADKVFESFGGTA